MLLSVLAFGLALSGQTDDPAPYGSPANPMRSAPRTMERFADNDMRWAYEHERRERNIRARQIVIDQRIALADRLDRLIAAGDCVTARGVAVQARYRDIREAVDKVCDARGDG